MSLSGIDQFKACIAQSDINLPYCALLMARILAYPNLDIDRYLDEINSLSESAGQLLSADMSDAEKGELLATYLFAMEGFKGNALHYGDPRNSFLNEILDRRLGIPISLSTLFIAVADKLGLKAYGIGMPGHFIVAVSDQGTSGHQKERHLFDPFHGGMTLTRDDCAALVAQTTGYRGEFLSQWLDPTPPQLILARMLNNLRAGYINQQSWEQAQKTVQLLQILQPSVPEHVRDEGLIALQGQNYLQAVQRLERYLQDVPEATDKEAIQDGIAHTLDRWVMKN